ncbi:hypothetical protein Scep_001745 [Stephania cephalantha]|uniref:Uncharacterized protein n=1 Tax=Stephania cephalantha TaxID=152367 RepID=A0AAP0Q5C2_9MAGN
MLVKSSASGFELWFILSLYAAYYISSKTPLYFTCILLLSVFSLLSLSFVSHSSSESTYLSTCLVLYMYSSIIK